MKNSSSLTDLPRSYLMPHKEDTPSVIEKLHQQSVADEQSNRRNNMLLEMQYSPLQFKTESENRELRQQVSDLKHMVAALCRQTRKMNLPEVSVNQNSFVDQENIEKEPSKTTISGRQSLKKTKSLQGSAQITSTKPGGSNEGLRVNKNLTNQKNNKQKAPKIMSPTSSSSKQATSTKVQGSQKRKSSKKSNRSNQNNARLTQTLNFVKMLKEQDLPIKSPVSSNSKDQKYQQILLENQKFHFEESNQHSQLIQSVPISQSEIKPQTQKVQRCDTRLALMPTNITADNKCSHKNLHCESQISLPSNIVMLQSKRSLVNFGNSVENQFSSRQLSQNHTVASLGKCSEKLSTKNYQTRSNRSITSPNSNKSQEDLKYLVDAQELHQVPINNCTQKAKQIKERKTKPALTSQNSRSNMNTSPNFFQPPSCSSQKKQITRKSGLPPHYQSNLKKNMATSPQTRSASRSAASSTNRKKSRERSSSKRTGLTPPRETTKPKQSKRTKKNNFDELMIPKLQLSRLQQKSQNSQSPLVTDHTNSNNNQCLSKSTTNNNSNNNVQSFSILKRSTNRASNQNLNSQIISDQGKLNNEYANNYMFDVCTSEQQRQQFNSTQHFDQQSISCTSPSMLVNMPANIISSVKNNNFSVNKKSQRTSVDGTESQVDTREFDTIIHIPNQNQNALKQTNAPIDIASPSCSNVNISCGGMLQPPTPGLIEFEDNSFTIFKICSPQASKTSKITGRSSNSGKRKLRKQLSHSKRSMERLSMGLSAQATTTTAQNDSFRVAQSQKSKERQSTNTKVQSPMLVVNISGNSKGSGSGAQCFMGSTKIQAIAIPTRVQLKCAPSNSSTNKIVQSKVSQTREHSKSTNTRREPSLSVTQQMILKTPKSRDSHLKNLQPVLRQQQHSSSNSNLRRGSVGAHKLSQRRMSKQQKTQINAKIDEELVNQIVKVYEPAKQPAVLWRS